MGETDRWQGQIKACLFEKSESTSLLLTINKTIQDYMDFGFNLIIRQMNFVDKIWVCTRYMNIYLILIHKNDEVNFNYFLKWPCT